MGVRKVERICTNQVHSFCQRCDTTEVNRPTGRGQEPVNRNEAKSTSERCLSKEKKKETWVRFLEGTYERQAGSKQGVKAKLLTYPAV